jgi:hypothetical protein
MIARFGLSGVLSLFAIVLAGCGGQRKVEVVDKICPAGVTREAVFEASEAVLRDLNFSIDKDDPNAGVIITRPLAGGQFFEFWRKDNVGAFEAAESNLQSIRRRAELKVDEEGGRLCIRCKVNVERLSLSRPTEQSVGFKYDRITGQRIRLGQMKIQPEGAKMAWIDLGNDDKLAAVILKEIEAKAIK